jgi:hypothetical protein
LLGRWICSAKSREKVLSLAKKEQELRGKHIGLVEELQKAYPELTFIIDGVEQQKRIKTRSWVCFELS